MKKILCLLCLVCVFILTGCAEQVDTGNRGIKTEWGEVKGEPLPEGLYWFNPFGGNIVEINCKTQRFTVEQQTYTKDVQSSSLTITVNFNIIPEQSHLLYKEVGTGYKTQILQPAVNSAVKDTIGKWDAAQLIANREKAILEIQNSLNNSLNKSYIKVTAVFLDAIDFSDAFERSVEEKVVAQQDAEKAVYKTKQVSEEAKQVVEKAQGDAKAMEIKSQALSKNQNLIGWELVQKWNGKLPENYYSGAPLPFIGTTLNKI